MNAIGINIYGGGFTSGVLHNFDVLGQWEECTLGARTFDLNFGGQIPHPLTHDEWPIVPHIGVPFVYANPPCAPWSGANLACKEDRFLDPRLALTQHTMDAAFQLQPKVFVCESVENAYNTGKEYYEMLTQKWISAGYAVTFFLTDAVIHGLPSRRRRFHFIAHKYEIDFISPDFTYFRPMTVRDAIGDIQFTLDQGLPNHTSEHIRHGTLPVEVYRRTKKGENAHRTTVKMKNEEGYTGPMASFLVKKVFWDAPAFTVIGANHIVHPDGERMLSWRESMRLMGYPDDFEAYSSGAITKAVTPVMGKYLSGLAKKAIQWQTPVRKQTIRIVDWRKLGQPYAIGKMKHQDGME